MDAPDVWVANDDGTEIIRAREIATVGLDYNGNVTVRLAGHDSTSHAAGCGSASRCSSRAKARHLPRWASLAVPLPPGCGAA